MPLPRRTFFTRLLKISSGVPAPSFRVAAGSVWLLGLISAGGYWFLCRCNLGAEYPLFILVNGLLFGCYLAALALVQRQRSRLLTGMGLGFGLVFYALLVPAAPSLSDDIYRYLWEGRTQALGHNPYATPPDAAGLAAHRDGIYARLGAKTGTTALYPPVTQMFFHAAVRLHYSVFFFKCLLGLFFMGTCGLLLALLAHHRQPSGMVLLFAWNPLVIIETAGSGHFDIMAACLVTAAVLLRYRQQAVGALAVLAAACMTKYYALALVPLFFRQLPGGWRRPLAVFMAVVVLLWLPYSGAGTRIFDSLLIFYHHWCFNSLPYYWFMQAFNARGWYLALYAGTIGAVVLYGLLRPGIRIETTLLAVMAVMVTLSPVVYPWYLVWLLPFCLFSRSFPLVLFSLVVNLSYGVLPRYLAAGVWCENIRVITAQYAVLAGSCLFYYWAGIWRGLNGAVQTLKNTVKRSRGDAEAQ